MPSIDGFEYTEELEKVGETEGARVYVHFDEVRNGGRMVTQLRVLNRSGEEIRLVLNRLTRDNLVNAPVKDGTVYTHILDRVTAVQVHVCGSDSDFKASAGFISPPR